MLVPAARLLLAPHFVDSSFLGLLVGLAYGEKGGLQCPPPSLSWPLPGDTPPSPRLGGPALESELTFLPRLLSLRLGLE